jgi:hypothetical protein
MAEATFGECKDPIARSALAGASVYGDDEGAMFMYSHANCKKGVKSPRSFENYNRAPIILVLLNSGDVRIGSLPSKLRKSGVF